MFHLFYVGIQMPLTKPPLKNPEIYTFETAITSRYISEIFPKGKLPNPSFSHPRLKCVLTQGGATKNHRGKKPAMWRRTSGACGTKNFPSSEECFKCGAPRGWAERQIRLKRPGRSPSRRFLSPKKITETERFVAKRDAVVEIFVMCLFHPFSPKTFFSKWLAFERNVSLVPFFFFFFRKYSVS